MALPRLLHLPGFVQLGIRIDSAPSWWWPAAQAAALWPAWLWMARGALDGSEPPVGLLVLAVMAWSGWQSRDTLRASPRLDWLVFAMAATLAAALAPTSWHPVEASLFALVALGIGLVAFLPDRVIRLPSPALLPNTFVNRVVLKLLAAGVMGIAMVCSCLARYG